MFVLLFASTILVQAAGTTLRGNVLTYEDLGSLSNIEDINLQNDSLFIIDEVNGFLKAYFNVPDGDVAIPDLIDTDFPDTFFSNTSTGFLGDVDNFDSKDGFSRFKETNINNGTNASAGFIGVNDIGRSISIGIGSSNFNFLNLSLPNIGVLRLKSPSFMVFANDFFNGWLWVTDLNNGSGFTNPFTSMGLSPEGNLNISGNFTVNTTIGFNHVESASNKTGEVKMFCKSNNRCFITRDDGIERRLLDGGGGSILIDEIWNFQIIPIFEQGINISGGNLDVNGDANFTGTVHADDINSQGLFDRIDNVIEIDSDIIHNTTLQVLYVADTSDDEITINITFGTNSSFQVWDAEKKFKKSSLFVNILNSDGITIDHSAELNKKDKAFQFYFDGTFWNYGQIGKGQFVEISSPHDATTDFGDLIQESDNNTNITVIGSLEFTGIGIGSQNIISLIPTSVLESNANWKGVFIDGGVLDPTGEGADIVGFEVDFSNLNTTNNPVLHGIEITVPPRFDAMHIHEGQLVIDNKPTNVITTEFSAMDIRVDTVNLDSSSVWSAMGVTAVGNSTGTIAAVLARNQVEPIRQEVGTFTIPSQTEFAGRKTGGGSTWVDGVDGVEIFVVNGDEVYLGSSTQFSQIEVIMDTAANKDVQPTFWYNTAADTWTQFFPDDETSGFQSSSLISWEPDSISALWTNNGDPGAGDTTAGFWIKMIRIREEDPGTPIPTTMETGTVVAFGWDKTGLITINNLDVLNNISIEGNITMGQKITFAFGEIIDNIVDGWIRITGNLNVTGNLTVDTVNDNTIFAQLSSFVDQIPTNTTPTVITYNVQDDINRINHSTSVNPGELTITTAGVYFISPQPQVGKDSGGVKVDFDMFLQINRNGTFLNEPNSNIKLTIKDPDITDVIVLAFTIELEVGEKIRMMQRVSSDSVGMGLKNTNATSEVPRTPSIIFTMYRIGG